MDDKQFHLVSLLTDVGINWGRKGKDDVYERKWEEKTKGVGDVERKLVEARPSFDSCGDICHVTGFYDSRRRPGIHRPSWPPLFFLALFYFDFFLSLLRSLRRSVAYRRRVSSNFWTDSVSSVYYSSSCPSCWLSVDGGKTNESLEKGRRIRGKDEELRGRKERRLASLFFLMTSILTACLLLRTALCARGKKSETRERERRTKRISFSSFIFPFFVWNRLFWKIKKYNMIKTRSRLKRVNGSDSSDPLDSNESSTVLRKTKNKNKKIKKWWHQTESVYFVFVSRSFVKTICVFFFRIIIEKESAWVVSETVKRRKTAAVASDGCVCMCVWTEKSTHVS